MSYWRNSQCFAPSFRSSPAWNLRLNVRSSKEEEEEEEGDDDTHKHKLWRSRATLSRVHLEGLLRALGFDGDPLALCDENGGPYAHLWDRGHGPGLDDDGFDPSNLSSVLLDRDRLSSTALSSDQHPVREGEGERQSDANKDGRCVRLFPRLLGRLDVRAATVRLGCEGRRGQRRGRWREEPRLGVLCCLSFKDGGHLHKEDRRWF